MKPKLIILPHAGGAAHNYRVFQTRLADRFEVYCHEMPGHGRRTVESLMGDMASLTSDLSQHLPLTAGEPWIIFGHSMGALLAHSLLQNLAKNESAFLPQAFFASSTGSPAGGQEAPVTHLSDNAFWERICRYGGVPNEILAVPEFRAFFEPIVRQDMLVVETYQPAVMPYPVPIHICYGEEDITIGKAESWSQETTMGCICHPFPGSHFYLFEHVAELCDLMETYAFSKTSVRL